MRKHFFLILPMTCLLFQCALHQVKEEVETPEVFPEQFSRSGEASSPDQWWQSFNDAALDDLITRGLDTNLDLRSAWSRLQQFEALAVQARSGLFPEVNGSGSARRARSIFLDQGTTSNQLAFSVTTSYEVDLWRKMSSRAKAGTLDAAAAREDLEAIALSLSASITRTWYGIVAQREQLALLEEQLETSQKLLEVIEVRFSNAGATAVDVYQQREQLASVRAQIPPAREGLALLEHQLAVLLGEAPGHPSPTGLENLPVLPPLPETGVPADLIRNRPDLRAAIRRIGAADHRLAIAIADRYPSLRLSAEAGHQDSSLKYLFRDWIWNLTASITGPIVDAGRRKAEVERNRAVLQERLLDFEKTGLTALREVEDALVQEYHQQQLIDELDKQRALARSAYEAGRSRYLSGVGNFLTVLTEIQALQRVERSLISARKTLIDRRIALCQALGGTWTQNLTLPTGPATGAL